MASPAPNRRIGSCVSCSTATPRSASGTRCGSRVFVRSPEIGHVAGSKSISFHVANSASPDRTAVKIMNSISNLVAGRAPDSWTLATADATSRSCSARWWRFGGSVPRQRSGSRRSPGIVCSPSFRDRVFHFATICCCRSFRPVSGLDVQTGVSTPHIGTGDGVNRLVANHRNGMSSPAGPPVCSGSCSSSTT